MLQYLPKVLIIAFAVFFAFLLIAVTTKVNALDTHVEISEVMVGKSGASTDEFVEIYNPATEDVNLSNWKLARKTTSGTESDLVSTISGTIKSHSYFLFTPQTGYTGSASADQTYTTNNSITNDNTILLYGNDGATVIDKVGFGEALDNETEAETNPSSGTSRERKANSLSTPATMAIGGLDEFMGNGQDTDNNANDFIARSIPQPQNSQSPTEPIPTITPTEEPSITPTTTISLTPTPTAIATPTLTVSPTSFPILQFPKFKTVCKTHIISLHTAFLHFHIPVTTCTLIKL